MNLSVRQVLGDYVFLSRNLTSNTSFVKIITDFVLFNKSFVSLAIISLMNKFVCNEVSPMTC